MDIDSIEDEALGLHGQALQYGRVYQQARGAQFNVDRLYLGAQGIQFPWSQQPDTWQTVSESDPLELGVQRAPISGGNAVPAYIQRDAYISLRNAIRAATSAGGFVLLIGDSTVGKSRAAYEALLSETP